MIELKNILFPTDFSRCANQALSRAYMLAKTYGAQLHILHAIVLHDDDPHNPAYHIPDIEEIHQKLQEAASDKIDSLIRSYHADDKGIIKADRRGLAPAPVILEYADENNIDLIVMGTHGRRGLGHLLLGSVAEEVVRMADCAVMTIREQKDPNPADDIQNILVPVDFSEHAATALRNARAIAAEYNARLQLLHVIEESVHPSYYIVGKSSIFEIIPDIKDKTFDALQNMIEETPGADVEMTCHAAEGQAAAEIVKFAADHDSDMIVISTHGLTGLEHFLVGSVAEKVVRSAECPVLTVKPFGKSISA